MRHERVRHGQTLLWCYLGGDLGHFRQHRVDCVTEPRYLSKIQNTNNNILIQKNPLLCRAGNVAVDESVYFGPQLLHSVADRVVDLRHVRLHL